LVFPLRLKTKPILSRGSLLPPISPLFRLFSVFLHAVYTAHLYIVILHFCCPIHEGSHWTSTWAPHAFHERTTTAHAVYLCCIIHPFPPLPVLSHIIGTDSSSIPHTSFSRTSSPIFFPFGPHVPPSRLSSPSSSLYVQTSICWSPLFTLSITSILVLMCTFLRTWG